MADTELDALYDEYYEWVQRGIIQGWVEGPACATHDGVPSTDAEDAYWEEGGDPCQHVLRVWGPLGRAGQPTDLSL